ncbi:MAG: DNA mismatch repair protein MutS [Candidatus Heimdallarchaeota archaeon]|nr:MAG: DNA mismatch repair protein MutS [Candidatus Heimdallarchaeota archaeon]
MSGKSGKVTKAMAQYYRIKKDHEDTIVFFQLGDFYETFNDDAKIASKALDITLTSRGMGAGGERIPLAGVPVKAIDTYLKKMIDQGYKVAIVDQLEDAKDVPSGKIVKRGVTRVVTPGTVFETSILDKDTNNFLLSFTVNEKKQTIGLSFIDISTGEFLVTEFNENVVDNFQDEFSRFNPREVIFPDIQQKGKLQNTIEKMITSTSQTVVYPVNETLFNFDTAAQTLLNHFEVRSLAGYGCDSMVEGIQAAGAIISYLKMLKKDYPSNISFLRTLDNRNHLILDSNTQRNLEINSNAFDGKIEGSLLSIFTDINTSMGARLIRRWLLQPLRDPNEINARLNAIEDFQQDLALIEEISDLLSNVADFQRLVAKIKYRSVNARDLISLRNSLNFCLEILAFFKKSELTSPICKKILNFDVSDLKHVISLIDSGIHESPPVSIRDGEIIKPSYNDDLLQLLELKKNQDSILNEIEQREQERTSFNIKLGYNSIHGYYIEVTKAQLRDAGEEAVPHEYVRRQTLVNAERFITPELKNIEEKILNADEKIKELEYQLFCEIREKISQKVGIIRSYSELIAELDVLVCFTFTAMKNDFCKPQFINEPIISIIDGRHPVVEKLQKETGFVPNSISLKNGDLHIITGPNMSGKSVFIRQAALIVLMAQTGSWVPAKNCQLGITDKIFTRVGAFDRLAFGQSTFMLEMLETAHILHNSTPNSLIILDEVGRGTSTFDGLSLAWAIAEYIAKEKKSKTLFATHYHQLSELENQYSVVKNYHQTAKVRNGKLVLLYKIKEGSTDHSFGISVAKMAGIPKQVILQAQKKLLELEATSDSPTTPQHKEKIGTQPRQLSLAEALSKNVDQQRFEEEVKNLKFEILAFLKNYTDIDINYKTPIEALQQLDDIVNDMRELEKKIEEK